MRDKINQIDISAQMPFGQNGRRLSGGILTVFCFKKSNLEQVEEALVFKFLLRQDGLFCTGN
jgi:hypothetical protein